MDSPTKEWNASLCPLDPANYWVDDDTGERVCAATGERIAYTAAQLAQIEALEASNG